MFKRLPILLLLAVTDSLNNGPLINRLKRPDSQPPRDDATTPIPAATMPALDKGQISTTVPPNNSDKPATEDELCTTMNGQEGKCVPYHLCDRHNTTVTDYLDNINPSALDACTSTIDTCCLLIDLKLDQRPESNQTGTATNFNNIISQIFGTVPSVKPDNQTTEDELCTTLNGQEGKCIPYHLCDRENTTVTNYLDNINPSALDACTSIIDTCCPLIDLKLDQRPESNQTGTATNFNNIISQIFGTVPSVEPDNQSK